MDWLSFCHYFCYPGEGLPVTAHPAELVLQKQEMGFTASPQLPGHPALLQLCASSSAVSLASNRNLELNGLGINCLNASVQISSLTSYLKSFLKYTGALCTLLYKL